MCWVCWVCVWVCVWGGVFEMRRASRVLRRPVLQKKTTRTRPPDPPKTKKNPQAALSEVRDAALRHTLQFGVGLHHAGLPEPDRALVERLFVARKIQVLVATSTLAWGVNTPAHLVIIKGTEYYDAASRRYVDFPITDVLQMMGRAGRPQYDKHGVAVVMVAEPKKAFYKRFLYEPFPVESSLREQVGFLGGGAWVWVAAGGWERSAVVCVVAWWCGVRAPGALSRC